MKERKDILRFTTAGSVDDGKSTLIGRLLYDSHQIPQDQIDLVQQISRRKGLDTLDLSLFTDGLKDERAQGITIDVAYRYFATEKRKFIIADTPGHLQYTRNMVTGASTANAAIILIDARKGVLEQTRRHSFIASLLQIQHLIVCVNKMDLVNYNQDHFDQIVASFLDFSAKLDIVDVQFIPISALVGDHVVHRSENMPWYQGATLLHILEHVSVANDVNQIDFRFPIQHPIRIDHGSVQDYRAYAGKVESGIVRVGDEIQVLPGKHVSKVKSITGMNGCVEEAFAPQSISLELTDELDVSRGDLLVKRNNQPMELRQFSAMLCWMSTESYVPGRKYILRHTTKEVKTMIKSILYVYDMETLKRIESSLVLNANDLARVELHLAAPIFVDSYRKNKATGSFILIDEQSNETVAAGMIS
jgi:sulfate adenylyltransferase subunit 1